MDEGQAGTMFTVLVRDHAGTVVDRIEHLPYVLAIASARVLANAGMSVSLRDDETGVSVGIVADEGQG